MNQADENDPAPGFRWLMCPGRPLNLSLSVSTWLTSCPSMDIRWTAGTPDAPAVALRPITHSRDPDFRGSLRRVFRRKNGRSMGVCRFDSFARISIRASRACARGSVVRRQRLASILAVGLLLIACGVPATASGATAEYPVRPIRYIVPSAAGGSPDITARILTAELSRQMGQQFVVDNRVGASGIIGTELIARAAPDGYTIGQGLTPALATMRSLLPRMPYDPDKDFQPVVQFYYTPNLLAVMLSLPVTSVRELIDHAKKNPGALLFASSGNGTTFHLGGELFKLMTGTQMAHVPYKAVQLAMTDMIAGRVHVMFNSVASIEPYVKAGKLRGLAVTSLKRSVAFPELPTVSEAGVPGFEVVAWAGVIAPAKTPTAIVARLNAEVNKALASPAVGGKLTALGYEVVGGTPQHFAEHIRKEAAKWADVIKDSGAKID